MTVFAPAAISASLDPAAVDPVGWAQTSAAQVPSAGLVIRSAKLHAKRTAKGMRRDADKNLDQDTYYWWRDTA